MPVRARLLGTMELQVGERRLPALESARAESVLAFLLLHRGAPQPRRRLAFALWPDSTDRQAQTNLRKALHTLRREVPELDELIDVGPRTLQWGRDVSLLLDVERFERAVAAGRFDEAVETYRGELLEGRYDEWLEPERRRLADLHLEALERLARRHADDGRWAAAIRCAERLLAHDPLREDGHRLLIRLCRAAGDRARAVRAYHACAATLERELGIEPAPETRALYDDLVAAGRAEAPRRPGTSPFVGRTGERDRLEAAWRRAAGGHAELVLVTGEAGIGKTRLVEELRARAGAVTLEARAYAAEAPVAYGIVTAWLRSPPVAARLGRLPPERRTELARLLPELGTRAGRPQPLSEAELRLRLLDAVVRALLGAGSPLLVVLDDAQWADLSSVRVVHHLLGTAPGARVLVAATTRLEDLDEGHPLPVLATALQGRGRCTEVRLGRLDRRETALLAESLTGAAPEPSDLERLHRDSEGNPLFVVEALHPDAPRGAGRVQAVIAARLARLSPSAAAVAGVAAAVGRAFTADVLAAATGLDGERFVAALDELWRRGIVRANGPNAYDFSHGRIRDAAYGRLSPPRRRQAHLAIARILAEHGAPPAAIARHYELAAATGEAIRWHERAARAAQRLHAHADAVQALERALALCDDLPPATEASRIRLRLLTALPAPLTACDGYASKRMARAHDRALELARELGTEPDPPLVWSVALAALTRGDWASAQDLGERLQIRAERDGDQVLWVESRYLQGIAAYWPGRLAAARGHFEAAMHRFRPARRRAHIVRYGQDPELLVRTRLAHDLWLLGDEAQAAHQCDLALAAAHDSTHPYSRAVARVWAAVLAVDRGDGAAVEHHLGVLRSERAGGAPAQVRMPIELFDGHLDVLAGRTAAGLARVRHVRDRIVHGEAPAPGVLGIATRVLLEDLAVAGEAQAGLALAGEALGTGRGTELWEAEIRRLRATFLAALGAPGDAVDAELARALAVARRQGARAFEARVRGTLAERRAMHDGIR